MKPQAIKTGDVVNVNLGFASSIIQALLAWWLWPSSLAWWGFGVFSVIMGLSALTTLIRTFKRVWKLHTRRKTMQALAKHAAEPKASRLLDDDVLRKAGMIDG